MDLLQDNVYNSVSFHHTIDEHPRAEDYAMHAHEKNELYYFISGKGSYFVEGNEYTLYPGCIMIMRPSETHMLQISPDEPYERLAIHFSSALLMSADPEQLLLMSYNDRPLGRWNQYKLQELNENLIRSCLAKIIQLYHDKHGGDGYQQRMCLISHLLPVLYDIRHCFYATRQNLPVTEPKDIIGEVINYINCNLTEDWNLDTLASRFFISKSYLNHNFKQVTGSTIWEYVIIKRLMIARQRIRSGIPIMEVFNASGFNDYSSFYRRYKARFGVSPKDDRPRANKK